uniref:SH3 domain-containing protein n=1 Tax=Erpetoichthys calabaricus TaxID=27687 RepID=A0A8C4S7Q0_ERPCA
VWSFLIEVMTFLNKGCYLIDCKQVQCIRAYVAQQPDELSLEKADLLLVHQQTSDGWTEGTRVSDGERGWFPNSHIDLIVSHQARLRNLKERQRITQNENDRS